MARTTRQNKKTQEQKKSKNENDSKKQEENDQYKPEPSLVEKKEAEPVEDQQADQVDNAKTHPIVKPKQYLKKNYEELVRINRSKVERIFLLKAARDDQNWNFQVLGTKGSQYHVTVSTTVKCTCTDFRFKKKPCKHIYFIVTQVAQNDEILNYFQGTSAKISKAAYGILDQQLTERLRSRMKAEKEGKTKDIDLKDDTDCTICFTEMDKQNQSLEGCATCKKYFHTECLTAWKRHNPSCPLCRSALVSADTDPLGRLTDIKLDEA